MERSTLVPHEVSTTDKWSGYFNPGDSCDLCQAISTVLRASKIFYLWLRAWMRAIHISIARISNTATRMLSDNVNALVFVVGFRLRLTLFSPSRYIYVFTVTSQCQLSVKGNIFFFYSTRILI